MSCPCDDSRNVAERSQRPRLVRQASRRTEDARARLPGGVRPGVTTGSSASGSWRAPESRHAKIPARNAHPDTAAPPKSILKNPTDKFPYADTTAQPQIIKPLRFDIGKHPHGRVPGSEVGGGVYKRKASSNALMKHRDSIVVVDKVDL